MGPTKSPTKSLTKSPTKSPTSTPSAAPSSPPTTTCFAEFFDGQDNDIQILGSQRGLICIPTEIGLLSSTLTKLDLNRNDITSLPTEIGELTALTYLELAYNDITSLPTEIGELTALTYLGLAY